MLVNFFSGIIEAGWLIALAAIPIFFNPYSTRIFEADKTYILRSITLLMLIAYVIKRWSLAKNENLVKSIKQPLPFKNPISLVQLLVVVFSIIYLISSLLSIDPFYSFKGYFLLEEGFYTLICYLIVFFLLILNLNQKEQLNRLINTIIFISAIVCIYGILQYFQIAPIIRAGGDSTRITSTLGNPIFLGAFLIMVIPVVLTRLLEFIHKGFVNNLGLILVLFLIFIAALICLIFTSSRGSFIGLLTGLFLFILLFARLKKIRWLFTTSVSLVVIAIIFFAILNISKGPLKEVKPSFGKFGELFETETGSGKVRVLIWEGAINILKSSPQRLAFGHGLESLPSLYHANLPASFARYEGESVPDHSHNDVFDILITSGIFGLLAYFSILITAIYIALKSLGLLPTASHSKLFLILSITGITLGAVIPIIIQKSFLIGLALPLGLISALFIYIIFTRAIDHAILDKNKTFQWLIAGLMSAIIANFAELQFGIGVTSTRLYFWIYLGLIILIAKNPQIAEENSGEKDKSLLLDKNKSNFTYTLIGNMILMMLLVSLLNKNFLIKDTIPNDFYTIFICALLLVFVLPLLFSRGTGLMTQLFSAFIGMFLTLIFYLFLNSILKNPDSNGIPIINIIYVFIGLVLFILASILSRQPKEIPTVVGSRSALPGIVFLLFIPILIIVIYQTNLREVYADIYCWEGKVFEKKQQWVESIASYQKSIALSPRNARVVKETGEVYFLKSDFQSAVRLALQAIQIDEQFPGAHMLLARAYQNIGEDTDKIIKAYADAFRLDPGNNELRYEIMKFGEACYMKLDFDAALKVNIALSEIEPREFQHIHNCAVILDEMGRLDEAIEYELKAIDLMTFPAQKEGIKKFLQQLEQKKAERDKTR